METPWVHGTVDVYNARGLKEKIPCTRHLVYTGGGLNPGLVVFPDGEMLVHLRSEAHHAGREGSVSIRRSKDGGFTWTEPRKIISKPGTDCRNQMMCYKGDTLVCLYCERTREEAGQVVGAFKTDENFLKIDWGPQKWRMASIVSKDRGDTWSEPVYLKDPSGFHLVSPYAGANICLCADGRMLAPAFCVKEGEEYVSQPVEEWQAFVVESKDGVYWNTVSLVPGWSDEVDISEFRTGILMALNRMGGVKKHAIYRQYSLDHGVTWNSPQLVAFDGMHPATSLRIGDEIIMTVGSRRFPYGARGVLSFDYGQTFDWVHQIVFADNCGIGEERHDNGYPTSVLLPDGFLYTIWYKSTAEFPYFEGTGNVYTAEATRVKWLSVWSSVVSKDE